MASVHVSVPVGRDFKASELIGKSISVGVSIAGQTQIWADGELIKNASKFVLTSEWRSITEAKLTLSHSDLPAVEEVTLLDNLAFSFLTVVSEVH